MEVTVNISAENGFLPIRSYIPSVFSRDERKIRGVMTHMSRSRYLPHYGAKEATKYATAAPHRLGGM